MQYVGNTDGVKQVIKGGYVWHKLKAVNNRILFLHMYFMCVWYQIENFCLFTAENEKDNVYMRNTVCMSFIFFLLCGWRAFIFKWMAGTNCVFNKFNHKLFINSTGFPRRSMLMLFLRRKMQKTSYGNQNCSSDWVPTSYRSNIWFPPMPLVVLTFSMAKVK